MELGLLSFLLKNERTNIVILIVLSSSETMIKASPILPSDLLHLIKDPSKIRIFDVRDSDYGEYGVIKNSINLPYALVPQYISEEVEKALADKIKYIITYCRYGRARSVITANKFAEEIASQDPHSDIKVSFLKDGMRGIIINKDYFGLLEDPMKSKSLRLLD